MTDAPFEGVPVPGLEAEYFHRDLGDRVASVGRYRYAGRELMLAWGYTDEAHCRYWTLQGADGWEPPMPGCPQVRVLRAGGRPDSPVTGLAVRDRQGRWISAGRAADQPGGDRAATGTRPTAGW